MACRSKDGYLESVVVFLFPVTKGGQKAGHRLISTYCIDKHK